MIRVKDRDISTNFRFTSAEAARKPRRSTDVYIRIEAPFELKVHTHTHKNTCVVRECVLVLVLTLFIFKVPNYVLARPLPKG